MTINCIIIDDFLDEPDVVRKSIIVGGLQQFGLEGNYPGARTLPAQPDYQEMIIKKLESIVGFKIVRDPTDNSTTFSFSLSLEDDVGKGNVHQDWCHWSGVLYLTPNAPIESGTIVFKEDTRPNPKNDDYNSLLTTTVGNIYNRLILFNGNLPHRCNLEGFGDSIETGRLTQHFFFNHPDWPPLNKIKPYEIVDPYS